MAYFIKEKLLPSLIVIALLVLCSFVTQPLLKLANISNSNATKTVIPQGTGAGVAFGILGGYRTLIADFIWIKGYVDWERKNLAGCMSAIELATTIDPDSIFYWRFGASIIAFDTPHWIIEQLAPVSKEKEKAIRLRQARQAIRFLNRALKMHPNNTELLIQKGQIAISIGDFRLAEECYEEIVKKPEPLIFSRRIYAAVLQKNGKKEKAKEVLRGIIKDLEPDNPILPRLKQELGER